MAKLIEILEQEKVGLIDKVDLIILASQLSDLNGLELELREDCLSYIA